MTKTSIINKFDEIEKNIELCKNPHQSVNLAFGVAFKIDKFMTYYNDFQLICEKSNFKLASIKTYKSIDIIVTFIVIKDISNYIDRLKMEIFLTWASDIGIIKFFY